MPVPHETMRRVLQEHVDAENAHDHFEDVPAATRYVGADEIVGNYRHLWDGFPGLVRRIDRWTFGDDSCVIELTLTGVHEGPYRGLDPTGRRLALRVIAHFQFDAEGRIQQETAYYDTATFRRQLGLERDR